MLAMVYDHRAIDRLRHNQCATGRALGVSKQADEAGDSGIRDRGSRQAQQAAIFTDRVVPPCMHWTLSSQYYAGRLAQCRRYRRPFAQSTRSTVSPLGLRDQ